MCAQFAAVFSVKDQVSTELQRRKREQQTMSARQSNVVIVGGKFGLTFEVARDEIESEEASGAVGWQSGLGCARGAIDIAARLLCKLFAALGSSRT